MLCWASLGSLNLRFVASLLAGFVSFTVNIIDSLSLDSQIIILDFVCVDFQYLQWPHLP